MSGKQKMLIDALHGAIEELTIDTAAPGISYEVISNLVKRVRVRVRVGVPSTVHPYRLHCIALLSSIVQIC